VSSAEFAEWIAYYRLEPFGDDAIVVQIARFAALYANAHRGRQRATTFEARDFLAPRTLVAGRVAPVAPTVAPGAVLRSRIDAAMVALGGRKRG
jgi:hypothetical protein